MKSNKPTEEVLNPLKILKIVTWPVGVWPLSEDDVFSIFRTFLVIVIEISLVTCVTIEITLGCCTPEEKIDFIEFQKLGTIAALKVLSLRFHRKYLAQIISSVKDDMCSMTEAKYTKIMKTYVSRGNFVFYAQTFSTATIISLEIISSLAFSPDMQNNSFNNNSSDEIFIERGFPVRTKCLFMNVSTNSYLTISFMQSIQLISTAFGNVGTDIFFFNISMLICGQLEILYEEISKFQGTDDAMRTKFKIIQLIKRHQHLWREAQFLEKAFSLTILVQLVVNITGICSYGIQGLVNIQMYGILGGLKSIFASELLMVQLFLFCYAGEKLSSNILKISLASYESCWYNLPKKMSQDVLFILMMAGVPFSLTAGKMLSMNLKTFSSIVKATFSFFSVLRLMFNS